MQETAFQPDAFQVDAFDIADIRGGDKLEVELSARWGVALRTDRWEITLR